MGHNPVHICACLCPMLSTFLNALSFLDPSLLCLKNTSTLLIKKRKNMSTLSIYFTVSSYCQDCFIAFRSVKGNSIADHLVYFGVELMGCGDLVGLCRTVADPRLMKYGGPDAEGNIILSRTPVSSAIRLRIGYTNRDQII